MIISILAILALAACGDKDEAKDNAKDEPEVSDGEGANEEPPEADLDDIPDIVAEVNGEEVVKDDFVNAYQQQFQQLIMQAQMSGQSMNDIDQDQLKEQTLEMIVGQNLLIQEAKNKITDVSDDDINKTIDQLLEDTEMESKEDLLALFEEQGMDEEEFMSQVETQVKVDQLITDISKDIKLTEDEVKESYETLKAQQEQAGSEEEFPEFDEIKSDLEEQLKEQKKGAETNSFVESLREKADVTIHL